MKNIIAKTRKEAKKKAPECIVFVKNAWGFIGFTSHADYKMWKNQK